MSTKQIEVMNALPVHPGRGEPSRIELIVELLYLKNNPIAREVLSEDKALKLASQLLGAVVAVRGTR